MTTADPIGSRVVHVTSAHPPGDARIHWRQCASLAAAGFDAHLVAPGPPPERSAPGVTVHGFESAGDSRVRRLTGGIRRAVSAALALDPAVVHLHDPELLAAVPWIKATSRARIVLDLHEDLALQIQHKPWLPTFAGRILAPTVRAALRASRPLIDLYVVAWPHPIPTTPASRTIEVHNYPPEAEFGPGVPYEEREDLVVAVGSMTTQRAFVELLETARLLKDRPGTRVVLAGAVSPASLLDDHRELIAASGAEVVGRLDRSELADLMAGARIGLCLLHPTPQYRVAEPTKVFEYLLAGLPVIGCNFGPTIEVIERHECGIAVDPLDPGAVAAAVRSLLDDPAKATTMAANARAAAPHYVWERQAEGLIAAYRKLLD